MISMSNLSVYEVDAARPIPKVIQSPGTQYPARTGPLIPLLRGVIHAGAAAVNAAEHAVPFQAVAMETAPAPTKEGTKKFNAVLMAIVTLPTIA